MKQILVVDDNDRYANNLEKYFETQGVKTTRAYDAAQGWDLFNKGHFDAVITDITMETQISGLGLARKIHKSGYQGQILIATTGFDFPGVMFLSRYILSFYCRLDWMIPKKPLKKGEVLFYPTIRQKEKSFTP